MAVQTVAHAVTLRAKLPRRTPERLARLFAKLLILRPRQGANTVTKQQLFDAGCLRGQPAFFADRQDIAIAQWTPFQTTKRRFKVGTARTEHFRHVDTA